MKTFRKSSLITSVALLLVAIVALGGATFAWFSTNNTATAGTLEMTATSASGLYIAETALEGTAPETGWSSKITWTDNVDSMPAVSGNASAPTAFFKTSTDQADGKWNGTDPILAANANTDFIVKKIWVKADTSDEVTLTITPTVAAGATGEMKGYERIAIVDDNGAVIMSNAIEEYDAFTSQAGATETITTEAYGAQTYTGKLDTAKCFYVYMWFEGQDAECYNLNSGANFKLDLAFAI